MGLCEMTSSNRVKRRTLHTLHYPRERKQRLPVRGHGDPECVGERRTMRVPVRGQEGIAQLLGDLVNQLGVILFIQGMA